VKVEKGKGRRGGTARQVYQHRKRQTNLAVEHPKNDKREIGRNYQESSKVL
jgi:hypothetical protein